ncbi:MAG: carboxypeptidase-like regulatory domain-containing protein [Candidatus Eremiobacteraeota bacterium]|nr:carboxypeptidase-like regulatory domain-containing protein [Candidatus Eremiobacteraeota bacterium]
MKVARLLGALFALAVLVGCNDDALPPGGTYSTIQGVVLDRATNQPVANATVTFDTVLKSTTDSAGKFTLNVPSGDFDYFAEAPGYKTTHAASGHADPGKTVSLNVLLDH